MVSALLGIPPLREQRTRTIYIGVLEREMGYPLQLTRHDVDHLDVWCIIDGCLALPGAMHTFLDILDGFHGSMYAMGDFRELVHEHVPEPLLTPDARKDLYDLAAGIPPVRWDDLYRAAVGPLRRTPSRRAKGLVPVLRDLEEAIPHAQGQPSLVLFLKLLANRLGGPAGARIRDWVAHHMPEQGNPPTTLTSAQTAVAPCGVADLPPCYFVVQLESDDLATDRYLLTAWLQRGNGYGEALHRDDRPLLLAEVPSLVDELLGRLLEEKAPEIDELMVEFILPRPLIGHPVDQWRIGTWSGYPPHRLGIEHQVTVRCLERLRRRSMHRHWRRKWAWMQGHRHRLADPDCLYWADGLAPIAHEALFAELIIESRVCLVMLSAPRRMPGLDHDEYATGVHAGVPVMVWYRGESQPKFGPELRTLIADAGIAGLPAAVRRLRLEASRPAHVDTDHLGRSISLLWDDFDRMPEPHIPLVAPE